MHPFPLTGELAGLTTAVLWSFSTIAWTAVSARIGPAPASSLRLVLAASLLLLVHRILLGTFWPADVAPSTVGILALSGVLGLGVADLLLFKALPRIGPRVGTLVMAVTPVLTTLLALLPPLSERPGRMELSGILLTVLGIGWVIAAPRPQNPSYPAFAREYGRGLFYAFGAAFVAAVSYLLSRMGLRPPVEGGAAVLPFSAGLIRVVAGMFFTLPLLALLGQWGAARRALRDMRLLRIVALGTLAGPVIGMWTSMIALQRADAGAAVALIQMSPLVVIPLTAWLYGERPTRRIWLGTVAAMIGVVLLLVRKGG